MFHHYMAACMRMFGYNMKGVSKRSAFVIDKDGIVRYAEVLENASEQPNLKTSLLFSKD
jgi:peroxiredoxin